MRSFQTGLIIFAGTIAALAADDATARKGPAAPDEDAIAAAKREFDALKAARTTPDLTTAELPKFAAPRLQVGDAAYFPPTARAEDRAGAKKKSANWLVDAMAAPDRKSDLRGTRQIAADGLAPGDSTDPTVEQYKERRPEKKPTDAVLNPLDRYLESWMTPQDLALLKPVLKADATSPVGTEPLRIPTLTETTRSPMADREVSSSFGAGSAGKSMPGRENPYLATLGVPSPASPPVFVSPPASAVNRANVPAPAPLTPASVPAQKPPTPGFVKPREDEKFNKQMKRF
ncbi:MAG: hypothetical protein HZA93_14555 [Verrucomicrobia bacterium]|nr:hypothetical protein [Verrucomicrobiota bacterium]